MGQVKIMNKTSILALDPSGTSDTGYIYYESYNNYEIGTIKGENAVEHAKKLDILLKNKQPVILAWEASNFFKMSFANYHMLELIHFNGILAYLASINNITHTYKILNMEVQRHLNNSEINGLEARTIKSPKNRNINAWFFRDKQITIHERDALGVFFVLWTVKLKKPWMFV